MRALGARPAPSATFVTRADAALADLEARVAAGAVLTKDDFDAGVWGDWPSCKRPLMRKQLKHCGYCEARVAGHTVQVDHRAPKLQVHDLATPGAEDGTTGEVSRRTYTNSASAIGGGPMTGRTM